MEFLDTLKLISIPSWLKWALIAAISFAGLLNMWVFTYGVLAEHREWYIHASIELASIIIPVFIILVMLVFSDTGVNSLIKNTEKIMTVLLPKVLENVAESDSSFFDPFVTGSHRRMSHKSRIFVNLKRSECYGDLIIFVPTVDDKGMNAYRMILIRIEINVYKINFDLCLLQTHLDDYLTKLPDGTYSGHLSDQILAIFKHTLAGAVGGHVDQHRRENTEETKHQSPDHTSAREGYIFNNELLMRCVNGTSYICLVGSRHFDKDFLWNAADKLFFAQDLMLMIRSFITESPQMFPMVSLEVFNDMLRDYQNIHSWFGRRSANMHDPVTTALTHRQEPTEGITQ